MIGPGGEYADPDPDDDDRRQITASYFIPNYREAPDGHYHAVNRMSQRAFDLRAFWITVAVVAVFGLCCGLPMVIIAMHQTPQCVSASCQ